MKQEAGNKKENCFLKDKILDLTMQHSVLLLLGSVIECCTVKLQT